MGRQLLPAPPSQKQHDRRYSTNKLVSGPQERNDAVVSRESLRLFAELRCFVSIRNPQSSTYCLRLLLTRTGRRRPESECVLVNGRALSKTKIKGVRTFRPTDAPVGAPHDGARFSREIAVPPCGGGKRSLEPGGNFLDCLQRRRLGANDRLDRSSGHQKLSGKLIGLSLGLANSMVTPKKPRSPWF